MSAAWLAAFRLTQEMALCPCSGELPRAAGTMPIGMVGNWAASAFASAGTIEAPTQES